MADLVARTHPCMQACGPGWVPRFLCSRPPCLIADRTPVCQMSVCPLTTRGWDAMRDWQGDLPIWLRDRQRRHTHTSGPSDNATNQSVQRRNKMRKMGGRSETRASLVRARAAGGASTQKHRRGAEGRESDTHNGVFFCSTRAGHTAHLRPSPAKEAQF
ncbi:hypothetical protein ANO11243_005690 [Dothideomycetidae sp. 11243]|nr:hypothetical protein ANO11243_005690 [fungal sp. No.11243]